MLYRPPLPMLLLFIAALAAAGVWGWLYARRAQEASAVRRALLIGCRFTALALLLWLLLGPSTLDHADSRTSPPTLNILLDTSASMAQPDATLGDAASPRLDAVRDAWLDEPTLVKLRAVSQPRLFAFDAAVRGIDTTRLTALQPTGGATNLLDAVARLHAAPGSEAITLILSDGHDTRGGADRALLDRFAATGRPIFAVPVGQVRDSVDLGVQAWAGSDFLFDGQQTTLTASLTQRGLAGRGVNLELFEGDRLLASREVTLDEASLRETFTVTAEAEPGQTVTPRHYRLRATLAEDATPEAYLDNNTADVFVQVSRQRIRVALFEGRPYWDTQALARALAADPQVELTAVFQAAPQRTTIVRDPRAAVADHESLMPIDQATLNDFDVVILGRSCEAFFGGARGAMLADYVRQRGGALVLARGKPFDDSPLGRDALSRIESLLPVQWGQTTVRDLRLEVTQAGRGNPLLAFDEAGAADAVITRLPGMIAATRVQRERAASLVLLRQSTTGATEQGMAAVATQRVGGGRVLAVLTDGLWRWSLLPPAADEQAGVYQVFWSRAIQWLATGGDFLPGQEVSLTLDRLSAEPGQPVTATVSTRYVTDDRFAPQLRITGPRGQTTTIDLQRDGPQSPNFRGVIEGQAVGVYQLALHDAGASAMLDPAAPMLSRFAVADRSAERQDPSARPQVLRTLTDATGGLCLGLDEADRLVEHLQSVQVARQRDVEPRYDFARWPVLAAVAGLLGLEWYLRRRVGLL